MRFLLYSILASFLFSCNTKETLGAQDIVDLAIDNAGGDMVMNSKIEFDFRDKNYCAIRDDNDFKLERMSVDDSSVTTDILSNSYFMRIKNEEHVQLADSMKLKYSNSVNSVHYFSVLPYGLNDAAAKKKLLGEVDINGRSYHKIEVTFVEEGGGTDHDDTFIYWINADNYDVDYLAYEFHVNGGGMRFREAFNDRVINGIRFVDYKNYKPLDPKARLTDLDSLFVNSKLELLSRIELNNVMVEECIKC